MPLFSSLHTDYIITIMVDGASYFLGCFIFVLHVSMVVQSTFHLHILRIESSFPLKSLVSRLTFRARSIYASMVVRFAGALSSSVSKFLLSRASWSFVQKKELAAGLEPSPFHDLENWRSRPLGHRRPTWKIFFAKHSRPYWLVYEKRKKEKNTTKNVSSLVSATELI